MTLTKMIQKGMGQKMVTLTKLILMNKAQMAMAPTKENLITMVLTRPLHRCLLQTL